MSNNDNIDNMLLSVLDRMIEESRKNIENIVQIQANLENQKDLIKNLQNQLEKYQQENKKLHEQLCGQVESNFKVLDARVETVDEKDSRISLYDKVKVFIGWKSLTKIFLSFLMALLGFMTGILMLIYRVPELLGTEQSQEQTQQVEKNTNENDNN